MSRLTLFSRITSREDDSINLYFKDVSRYPVLTPEQEKDYTKKYQELLHKLDNLDKYSDSKKEIQRQVEKLRNKLVVSNLRFVITVAKQYQGKGVPLVDLIQYGNIGLFDAIEHFNPDKGFRLMSYAIWWIRQAIVQALSNTSRMIRVPYTKATNLHKIIVAKGKYEQDHGEEPSIEKLSSITKLSVSEIEKILEAPKPTVSLETPFSSDSDAGNLLDITPDLNTKLGDSSTNNSDLKHIINMLLNKVDNRTHDVLCMFYGLNGVEPLSLKDIGDRFNFTEERGRQIKKKAITTFRDRYLKILQKEEYA